MPYITEIEADAELAAAMTNFAAICTANSEDLGLTAPQEAEITGAASAFNTSFNAALAAKAASHAAVGSKNTQKATSKTVISKWAKVFRANVAVSDSLLSLLLLPPHSTPGTESDPVTPSEVIAEGLATGGVEVKWNRNGNPQGTLFIIERQTVAGGAWTQIGTTKRRTFATTWTPGSYVHYRVSAQIRNVVSLPSIFAAPWSSEEESVQLQIAA